MRGELTAEQCDAVKKMVIVMFDECEVQSPPFDPFSIASKLQYILIPYSMLSPEGMLEALCRSDDAFSQLEMRDGMYRYAIYYNDCMPPKRIRWTLFHEIGHCYLGHHEHSDDSLSKIEEAEANLFAKYSVAPPPLVHVLQLKSPDDIARTFVITDDAAYNSYSYYCKWLYYGPAEYTDFERRLLYLMNGAA